MKRNYLFSVLLLFLFSALSSTAPAEAPRTGYRGFIDWSNSLRSDRFWNPFAPDGISRESVHYWGFSTSHGYQFNPWLFVGAGLDFEHCSKIDSNILSPYLHLRTDLCFGRLTPFGDIRLGYNLMENGGIYFSPTVGYRFNWGRRFGINIGSGLTLQQYKAYNMEITETPEGWITMVPTGSYHRVQAFFSFRVGIEF